ncbi:TetR/AcrR family transcriptional regulator [Phenylobacterium sp.]|uniref:TetR/AcrR family transcriptional regulator n=1 Tax=Phenylobacterium sp. TaxID=1871053 RepID=UPI0012141C53|nr:TetR/AcrR family transcriptional regulator [Phenylobacterium sp.]THD58300.1 MAG: TetR/AcrR family transcriptional regulator [Phenylobacterium sp.]
MVQKEARARGRPRSFDADEVLDKARSVFWNLGYAAASLDDIALATGLKRPSLYAAFGDKHALYMAALTRTRTRAVAAMAAMVGREGALRAVLVDLFEAVIGAYVEGEIGQRGCFIIGTAVTQAVEDPQARALATAFVADEDALFRERFAHSASELAPGLTADAAAMVATAALHTLAIRARLGEPREALAQVAAAAIGAICGPA